MLRSDGGLELVGVGLPLRAAQRVVEKRDPAADRRCVPQPAILPVEGDDLTVLVEPRGPAGLGEQQQSQDGGGHRLIRQQLVQELGQPDRLRAGVHVVGGLAVDGCMAGRVEAVDHRAHGGQAIGELVLGRHPVGDVGRRDLLPSPGQALRRRGFSGEEHAGDLRRGETAEGAQGKGDPGRRGERGVAAGEDQPQQVVVNDVVRRKVAWSSSIIRSPSRSLPGGPARAGGCRSPSAGRSP